MNHISEANYKEVLPVEGHNVPGFVRLVDHMGSDLDIVRAARVSYDADERAGEDDGSDYKLINYLLRNRHTTPFEMATVKFEVKAPLFVLRQWHRHRTWSYNEVSARYTELDEGFYVPKVGMYGVQSKANKQQRDIAGPVHDIGLQRAWRNQQIEHIESAIDLYKWHIKASMPRELARSILPTAMYSRMFASVDLHNFMHFITLRAHSHAQYEIRVYAEAMLELVEPLYPVSIGAFRKHVLEEVK
jgi:thymidylate synthase (FAD)